LLVSLVLGLVVGLGMALLRSSMDTRIKGEADVSRVLDTPLLGGIAYDQSAAKKPLLTQTAGHSQRAETFRQLRTNLQFANIGGRANSVLVTSSLPGEGKSTTAANLAITMAESGQTVCLVDADLRRPMVGTYLGLDRSAGLTTALVGQADVDELLQPWGEDNLFVLTSGQIPPNPSELLGSDSMRHLIAGLEQAFDAVIIDAPPLLPVTDAAVLSQSVGGVLVVVGAGRLRQQDLEKSFSSLELVGANILGVVMNLLPARGPDAYSYSYYSPIEGNNTPSPSSRTEEPSTSSRRRASKKPKVLEQSATRPAGRFPSSRLVGDQAFHPGSEANSKNVR